MAEPVLTDRENAILLNLAAGRSYQEIADELGVSYNVIITDKNRIFKKINVKSRFQAILWTKNSKSFTELED